MMFAERHNGSRHSGEACIAPVSLIDSSLAMFRQNFDCASTRSVWDQARGGRIVRIERVRYSRPQHLLMLKALEATCPRG
jgi:hypothetical protein